jgi:hypothetical protein
VERRNAFFIRCSLDELKIKKMRYPAKEKCRIGKERTTAIAGRGPNGFASEAQTMAAVFQRHTIISR